LQDILIGKGEKMRRNKEKKATFLYKIMK